MNDSIKIWVLLAIIICILWAVCATKCVQGEKNPQSFDQGWVDEIETVNRWIEGQGWVEGHIVEREDGLWWESFASDNKYYIVTDLPSSAYSYASMMDTLCRIDFQRITMRSGNTIGQLVTIDDEKYFFDGNYFWQEVQIPKWEFKLPKGGRIDEM